MITRRVRDVMTADVVIATDVTPFKEIVRLLSKHGVSALPVVAADRRLIGIVSEADLLAKEVVDPEADREPHLFRSRRRFAEKADALVATQLMTTPVASVGADASIREAARSMHERKVKRLPVVDTDGRVVGIVSRADLLKVFLRPDVQIADEVTRASSVGRSRWSRRPSARPWSTAWFGWRASSSSGA
jgi:CBS domain-containing protein